MMSIIQNLKEMSQRNEISYTAESNFIISYCSIVFS